MAKGRSSRNNRHHHVAKKAPPKPVIKTPILDILRDQEVTKKIFDSVLESSNGRRSLSRLARTCKALSGPALDSLWQELDSFVPILGLFPNSILRKARRPSLGLAKAPESDDWANALKYCDRVRRITYNEGTNNLASVFPMLESDCPRLYMLPNLEELTWKVQTASGLDRCMLFLNPSLKVVNLHVESQLPQFRSFFATLSSRTKLTGFSFVSPTYLPDNFTELLHNQKALEKVILIAPGALGSDVGRWIAKLPKLKHLQLDLTGRSDIAVEGFFDKVAPQSGYSTPSSIGSTDSGVFSNEELDFSQFRKSAVRLTADELDNDGYGRRSGPFKQLTRLTLTGDVANVNVFLNHLPSTLTHLELVIEDPPDRIDWQDFCELVCEKFAESLQSLRISATSRSPARGETANSHLSLQHLTYLPELLRLDIDLPESVIFKSEDLERIAQACPRLEVLRLCPLARFAANSPPQITLESISLLTIGCANLHTLYIVVDAHRGSPDVLFNRFISSPSLQRIHFGNSWVNDPLQVSILLSHLAPNLEFFKWFQDKNKPGYNEVYAKNWQTVAETLPHLQGMRAIERSFTHTVRPVQRILLEKCVDATIETLNIGVQVRTRTISAMVQATPAFVNQQVDATVETHSISIDATPAMADVGVGAVVSHVDQSIGACPETVSIAIETTVIQEMGVEEEPKQSERKPRPALQPMFTAFSSLYRIFIFYPLSLPSRIINLLLENMRRRAPRQAVGSKGAKSGLKSSANDIPMETIQVD